MEQEKEQALCSNVVVFLAVYVATSTMKEVGEGSLSLMEEEAWVIHAFLNHT